MDVRQILLVLDSRQSVTTNNTVEFGMSLRLNLGVCGDKSREPLHNRGRLKGDIRQLIFINMMPEGSTYSLDTTNHECWAENGDVNMIQPFFLLDLNHRLHKAIEYLHSTVYAILDVHSL